MSRHGKALVALFGAAIAFGALVGTASAGRLSTSSRNIRAAWAELGYSEPLFGASARCPVTLEGSLHSSTIAKVAGALVGHVSRGTVNNAACTGGRATILQASLPWHIRYGGFSGTLPNITSIVAHVIGASYRGEGAFGICLFTSSLTQPVVGTYNRNTSTRSVTSMDVSGSLTSNENCGAFGERITVRLSGRTTSLTQLGSTGGIIVTLI